MSIKLFGIKFSISYAFALSLTIFVAFDKSGNLLPLILAILIHEVSHLLVMCYLNAKPDEIYLAMGTINIKNKHILTISEEICVLLAGPIANLILYLIFTCFNTNFANINLILFIYNMLCIDGLDGGSILKAVLNNYLSVNFVKQIMLIIKMFNVACFIAFFLFCLKNNFANYTFLFFIVYILIKR